MEEIKAVLVWKNYGPYHHARCLGAQSILSNKQVIPLQIGDRSSIYKWTSMNKEANGLISLCPGKSAEHISPITAFFKFRSFLIDRKINVAFLPSYSPSTNTALLLAAKVAGVKTVMFNDSHRKTVKAKGLKLWIKKQLIKLFDAGLVAGIWQTEYFESMGMNQGSLFTGYDVVDNDFFNSQANEFRANSSQVRNELNLPERFFLNIGRMIKKKNLGTLIRAYKKYLDSNNLEKPCHLVLVGDGDEREHLVSLTEKLKLPLYLSNEPNVKKHVPGVHVYPFQQIDVLPKFLSLAEAFILPSTEEEWGLVINEAMASSIPIIVSDQVGSSPELVISMSSDTPTNSITNETGFLFAPMDTDALSAHLSWISQNPDGAKALGQNGLLHIDNYSCETFGRGVQNAAHWVLSHAK